MAEEESGRLPAREEKVKEKHHLKIIIINPIDILLFK